MPRSAVRPRTELPVILAPTAMPLRAAARGEPHQAWRPAPAWAWPGNSVPPAVLIIAVAAWPGRLCGNTLWAGLSRGTTGRARFAAPLSDGPGMPGARLGGRLQAKPAARVGLPLAGHRQPPAAVAPETAPRAAGPARPDSPATLSGSRSWLPAGSASLRRSASRERNIVPRSVLGPAHEIAARAATNPLPNRLRASGDGNFARNKSTLAPRGRNAEACGTTTSRPTMI